MACLSAAATYLFKPVRLATASLGRCAENFEEGVPGLSRSLVYFCTGDACFALALVL